MTRQEHFKKGFYSRLTKKSRAELSETRERLKRTKTPNIFTTSIKTKIGTTSLRWFVEPILDDDGEIIEFRCSAMLAKNNV